MWKVLKRADIPVHIIDILISMYDGASSIIRTEDGDSDPFSIRTGVRQGDIISAMIFNFVLDYIMFKSIIDSDGVLAAENLVAYDLDYADDIAVLQPDELSMQHLLDRICLNAEKLGLKIKPSKTKAMVIHAPDPILTVYNEDIEVVEIFTYQWRTNRIPKLVIDPIVDIFTFILSKN